MYLALVSLFWRRADKSASTTENGSLISIQKVVSPQFVNTPSCCSVSRSSRCTLSAWYRDMSGGDSDGGKRSDMTRWLWSANTTGTLTFLAKMRALHFNHWEEITWSSRRQILTSKHQNSCICHNFDESPKMHFLRKVGNANRGMHRKCAALSKERRFCFLCLEPKGQDVQYTINPIHVHFIWPRFLTPAIMIAFQRDPWVHPRTNDWVKHSADYGGNYHLFYLMHTFCSLPQRADPEGWWCCSASSCQVNGVAFPCPAPRLPSGVT